MSTMWHIFIAVWLAVGAHAFTLAPIERSGDIARKFILLPQSFLDKTKVPQDVTIRDRLSIFPSAIPQFKARLDSTIAWEGTGLCIEACGQKVGDRVRISHCTGTAGQRWKSTPSGHGRHTIQLMDTQICLGIGPKEATLSEAVVELQRCDDELAQAWKFDGPASLTDALAPSSTMRHTVIMFAGIAVLVIVIILSLLQSKSARVRTTPQELIAPTASTSPRCYAAEFAVQQPVAKTGGGGDANSRDGQLGPSKRRDVDVVMQVDYQHSQSDALAVIASIASARIGISPGWKDSGRIVRPNISSGGFFDFNRISREMILPKRDVRVWLPKSYNDRCERRHPVLYCHDGQHMIAENEDTFPPERSWRLGSTLSKLIETGLIRDADAPIVVLINNCHQDGNILGDIDMPVTGQPMFRRRWLEYGDGPIGEQYTNWVCDILKPAIDKQFRTLAEPQHTYAMGSSMGGTVAFNSVWRRPDKFGHFAALSPVFQTPTLADVALKGGHLFGNARHERRIYIDNGGDADDVRVSPMPHNLPDALHAGWWWLDTSLQPGVDAMCALLKAHNVDFMYHKSPGGRHNEVAWAARVELPLLHLFGKEATRSKASPSLERDSDT